MLWGESMNRFPVRPQARFSRPAPDLSGSPDPGVLSGQVCQGVCCSGRARETAARRPQAQEHFVSRRPTPGVCVSLPITGDTSPPRPHAGNIGVINVSYLHNTVRPRTCRDSPIPHCAIKPPEGPPAHVRGTPSSFVCRARLIPARGATSALLKGRFVSACAFEDLTWALSAGNTWKPYGGRTVRPVFGAAIWT